MKIRPFLLVEHVGLRYLEVIKNGMQIGELAQTPDGRYVQVNAAPVVSVRRRRVPAEAPLG